jgi:hypothetical protein
MEGTPSHHECPAMQFSVPLICVDELTGIVDSSEVQLSEAGVFMSKHLTTVILQNQRSISLACLRLYMDT